MGRVYKREGASGPAWYIDYTDGQGRRIRERAGKTKRQAELALAKVETAKYERRFFGRAQADVPTLTALRAQWLDHATGKKSLKNDAQRLERALEFFGPATQIHKIQPSDVDRYRAWLAGRPRQRGKGTLSPATVNRHLAVLRSALNMARRDGHIPNNPAAGIRMEREPESRDRIADATEQDKLLDGADDVHPELRLAIILGIETGMRLGDIHGLDWTRINLDRRMLRVDETKEGKRRWVPLSDHAIEALRETGPNSSGPLFSITKWWLSRRFAELCQRSGVPDLRFHDLRHTAATEVRRAGVDLFVMMKMFGWRSVATAKRYQTVDHDELLDAVDARSKRRKIS